jgi:tetratricopeptide (TPR) repeat protein
MSKRARYGWGAVIVVCALSHDALAESPAASSPTPEAARLFDEAIVAYDQGQLSLAIDKLQVAYGMAPSQRVLYNLAQFQEAAGRRAAAFDTFEEYLAKYGSALPPGREEAVRLKLVELRSRVTRLIVSVEPANAELQLDGALGPLPSTLEPGLHKLQATAPGFRTSVVTLKAEGGDTAQILLALAIDSPPTDTGPAVAATQRPSPMLPREVPPTKGRHFAPIVLSAAAALAGGAIATHVVAANRKSTWEGENRRLNDVDAGERDDDYWKARAENAARARSIRHLEGLELGLFVGAAAAATAGVGVWIANAGHPRAAAGVAFAGRW